MLKLKAIEVEVMGRQFKAVLIHSKLKLKVFGKFDVIDNPEQTKWPYNIAILRNDVNGLKSVLNDIDFTDLSYAIANELQNQGIPDVE